MSKYDEMSDSASTVRKNRAAYRDRCWQHVAHLVNGFITYCQIPKKQLTLLRWNEKMGDLSRYLEAEDGRVYTLAGATVLNESDGFFHLGIRITLSPPEMFPPHSVFFALCVADHEGKAQVKTGHEGKPRLIDLSNANECDEFYDDIVKGVKQCFGDPQKPGSKIIGFSVDSANS